MTTGGDYWVTGDTGNQKTPPKAQLPPAATGNTAAGPPFAARRHDGSAWWPNSGRCG